MLILNRRDFLTNATVFDALAATGIARGAFDEVGKSLKIKIGAFAATLVAAGVVLAGDLALPEGYKRLEWIESTGSQYIDTGVGETLRDFVPARRMNDKAVGLYDRVTKRFFANDGTGAFLAPGDPSPGHTMVVDYRTHGALNWEHWGQSP